MKKKLTITPVISVLLLLTLVMTLAVYAQGQGDDRSEEEGDIGGLGLADPPPPGFSVLYTFSGAADSQNSTPDTAVTSVHCTNAGTSSVQVMVQISDFDNVPTIAGTFTIASNRSATFSSHPTIFYLDDVTLSATGDDIDQGSGRVLINPSSAKVICTAQVLDPVNNPPEYVINLDLFKP